MRPDPYHAHKMMTAAGAAQPALWRLVLGALLALGVAWALGRALFAVAHWTLSDDGYWAFVAAVEQANTPLGMLVLLCAMGFLGIGAMVAAELLHDRPALTLFGPVRLMARQGLQALGVLALLYGVVMVLPPWPLAGQMQPGVPPVTWVLLLPLTCVALLIQTGAEELLFRGYLQTQLAARLRSPAAWLVGPAALFALGHYAPDLYGSNAWWVVAWAFAFGLAAGDLTARCGTLGPAIALHFVNNFAAMALTSLAGDLSGLALWQLPFGPGDEAALRALLPLDLAMLGCSYVALRLTFRV